MIGKYTLENFYRCDEWRQLLQVMKLERLNEEGELVCEYCKKPIVRAYDCIGHHSVPLTAENVNDISISLNPEKIRLVHHRCHNLIHEKFGRIRREVFLVYGSPMSGKSTWIRENAGIGDLIVDMDAIWQCVSGLDRYRKPGKLNAVVFGVRNELLRMVRYRVGKWNNAYIVGGYPLISERERLCREMGARQIFIDTDKKECLARLESCTDGRSWKEWSGYIEEWWRKYRR